MRPGKEAAAGEGGQDEPVVRCGANARISCPPARATKNCLDCAAIARGSSFRKRAAASSASGCLPRSESRLSWPAVSLLGRGRQGGSCHAAQRRGSCHKDAGGCVCAREPERSAATRASRSAVCRRTDRGIGRRRAGHFKEAWWRARMRDFSHAGSNAVQVPATESRLPRHAGLTSSARMRPNSLRE